MIVNQGLEVMKFLLVSGTTDSISHLGIGTGTNTPTPSATGLTTAFGNRFALGFDTSTPTKVIASGVIDIFTNNGSSFTEIGIFTQNTAGSFISFAVHDSITKAGSNQIITIERDIDFS